MLWNQRCNAQTKIYTVNSLMKSSNQLFGRICRSTALCTKCSQHSACRNRQLQTLSSFIWRCGTPISSNMLKLNSSYAAADMTTKVHTVPSICWQVIIRTPDCFQLHASQTSARLLVRFVNCLKTKPFGNKKTFLCSFTLRYRPATKSRDTPIPSLSALGINCNIQAITYSVSSVFNLAPALVTFTSN